MQVYSYILIRSTSLSYILKYDQITEQREVLIPVNQTMYIHSMNHDLATEEIDNESFLLVSLVQNCSYMPIPKVVKRWGYRPQCSLTW